MDHIEINFRKFHADNPQVYELFLRFARQLRSLGYDNGSASLIYERIRWEIAMTTVSNFNLKLNNNYRSRYARMAMLDYPELDGFFRIRMLRAHSYDSVAKDREGILK